jgi:hypothetical protein
MLCFIKIDGISSLYGDLVYTYVLKTILNLLLQNLLCLCTALVNIALYYILR